MMLKLYRVLGVYLKSFINININININIYIYIYIYIKHNTVPGTEKTYKRHDDIEGDNDNVGIILQECQFPSPM